MKKISFLKSPLKCSIYHPKDKVCESLIIYIHCFSGNKLEGKILLDYLKQNFAILIFDLRGSGNNKSEYVTLGLRESLDLDLIVNKVID